MGAHNREGTHDPSIRAQCDAVIDLAHFQDEEGQR